MGQRLRTYKRVSSARDEDTLRDILTEMQDRYGRLPDEVLRLFDYARLRLVAEEIGVISIDKTRDGIVFKLSEKARVVPEKLMALVEERDGTSFAPNGTLRTCLNADEMDTILETARAVLLNIKAEG
jgi:transcription-repair coupling factor (superfamily II helicase)